MTLPSFITIDQLRMLTIDQPKLAVLGYPVNHSLSPVMHNAALAEMAETDDNFKDWSYIGIEVPAGALPELLPLLHDKGFIGVNLTLPHKVDVFPLLESVDEDAQQIGAVNTLIRTESGWSGANTDGFGILKGIEEELDLSVSGKRIVLLGAGGASRAIAVACLKGGCAELTIVNRTSERLEELVHQLDEVLDPHQLQGKLAADFEFSDDGEFLVINATALGLKPTDPSPLSLSQVEGKSLSIYDTTYGCENEFRRLAQEQGFAYANGLSMLIWQGVRSLEIWTDKTVPASAMRKAAIVELEKRKAGQ